MDAIPSSIRNFLALHSIADGTDRSQLVTVVHAVANIPWGEGRTVEEVLETKKVGTCTGKHLVLAACCEALDIPYRTVVCTFRWSEQGIAFPEKLLSILKEGEWVHGHNFLQLQSSVGEWIDVDITWDPPLHQYGFLSLPADWKGEASFVGLQTMIDREDGASMERKKELLRALSPDMQQRRERFLKGFIDWIAQLRT